MVRRGRFALLVCLRGGMLEVQVALQLVQCRGCFAGLRAFLGECGDAPSTLSIWGRTFARRYGIGLRITGIPQGYVVRESLVLSFKGELLRARQVGFAVAPHVVERAASLSEVKAGGHGAAYEAFRAADGLLDGVALRKAAGDGA